MKLFTKGTIKLVEKVEFPGGEDGKGEPVIMYANYIQDGQQGVLKVVSHEDLSHLIDEEHDLEFSVRKDNDFGSKFKLRLDGNVIVA